MKPINKDDVISAEAALTEAMLNSDIDALERLLSDRLLFTNHLGMLMRKQDDINMHRQGIIQIHQIDASEQQIECFPHVAVVSVKLHIIGRFNQQISEADFRFTRLWQANDINDLVLIAGHACLILDPAS